MLPLHGIWIACCLCMLPLYMLRPSCARLSRLSHRSPLRPCAPQFLYTGETIKEGEGDDAKREEVFQVTDCSIMHMRMYIHTCARTYMHMYVCTHTPPRGSKSFRSQTVRPGLWACPHQDRLKTEAPSYKVSLSYPPCGLHQQVSGEASKLSNFRVRHGVGDITYDSGSRFVGQVSK